jgi:hypothetical protein
MRSRREERARAQIESRLILKVALLIGCLIAAVWTVEWLAGLRKLRLER